MHAAGTLPPHLIRSLETELDHDETLVWTGRPKQGVILRRLDALLIPFTLVWASLSFFIFLGVLGAAFVDGAFRAVALFPLLFLTPFLLAGVYITVGRFYVDARRRARTIYGLTERRAITVTATAFGARRARGVVLRNLEELSIEEARDGRGTIIFGRKSPHTEMAQSGWPGATGGPPLFERIEDARDVLALVREGQRRTGDR